jgi:hypothetical protein
LTAHSSSESDVIPNDIRLSVSLAGDSVRAELAYDIDAVEAGFAEGLLETFLHGRSSPRQRRAETP